MRLAPRLALFASVLICLALLPATAMAAPPINTAPPSFSTASPVSGQAVFAVPGAWSPEPTSIEYEWLICTSTWLADCATPGPGGSSYTPTLADKGKYLILRETARNAADESASAVSATVAGPVSWGRGIIDNGTIALGVRDSGSLNVEGGPTSAGDTNILGLRLLDGQYEGVSQGSPAEGWGFADGGTGVTGWSSANQIDHNTEVTSFSHDNGGATSVTMLRDESDNPYAQITHEFFTLGGFPNLYAVGVTIKPLALTGITQALYRRTVDWDIEPTPFDEVVSTVVGNATNLKAVSDEGFSSNNPLDELSGSKMGEVFNNGPGDIGAAFDFDFGTIPYGSTREFGFVYGAAPSRAVLLDALAEIGVETFSIAHSNTPEGYDHGGPASFALGFGGVGGDPVIDPGAPTATITSKPAMRTNSREAVFTFESDQPDSTFECSFNHNAWTTCSSPATYSDLKLWRNYSFSVRASKNGKTQALANGFNWYVTDRPFDLYFYDSPTWWGTNADAIFALEASSVDIGELNLQCWLDDAPIDPCSTSETFIGLDAGPHEFRVEASRDGVTEELSYAWTISNAIMTRFSGTPYVHDNDTTPYFEWDTAGPVAGVECKLGAGDWYDCSASRNISFAAGDGQHTFSIRAFDAGENRQSPVTSWTWTIDSRDPTISHNIPGVVTAQPIPVQFTADEPLAYFDCRIDAGPWNDCKDGVTIDGLADGPHSVEYETEDIAGNYASDTIDFVVDIGAAVATITSAPPWATTSRAASFAFTSTPGATFECQLDGNGFEPCSSPVNYDLLDFGMDHRFEVQATKDSHTQATPTAYSWLVTDKPFDLYFDSSPSRLTTDTNAYFEVDADAYNDDKLTYTCSLDGAAFTPCGESWSYSNLSPGTHVFALRGSDRGVTEEITYDWRIVASDDAEVWFTRKPDSLSNDTNPSFEWQWTSAVASVECRLDDEVGWSACAGLDWHDLSGLGEGQHSFSVRPRNDLSEPGPIESYSWSVDLTPPTVSADGVPSAFSLPFQLPLVASEDVSSLDCTLDGEHKGNCGWPLTLTHLALGAHRLEFTVKDLAGNESAVVSRDFTVLAPPAPPADAGGQPTVPPPAALKPGLTIKKPKAKAKQIKLTVVCPVAKCTVSGWVKVGKKKHKLKSRSVKSGKHAMTIKFNKKLARATKRAKKGKSRYRITVSGGGRTTRTGKF